MEIAMISDFDCIRRTKRLSGFSILCLIKLIAFINEFQPKQNTQTDLSSHYIDKGHVESSGV